jgi:hypothetical protein
MVSPLVTDTVIPGTGQYAALPGWYVAGPEIWTAAARPNVWGDILKDTYPKPGSLTYSACPSWYTWSYPDAGVTTEKPTYYWGMINYAPASQRTMSQASQKSETLTYTFYGSEFKWVYYSGPNAGIHSVKVDTVEVGPVNTYQAGAPVQKTATFSGFGPSTTHKVVIQNTSKDPLSTGGWLFHDYFIGKTDAADPVPTATRENNTDGSTSYKWGTGNFPGSKGGTVSSCKASNGAVAYTFNKTAALTSFTWDYVKAPNAGTFKVLVDGKQLASIDCYAAAAALGSSPISLTGFADGWHTIIILFNGKNGASTGSWCYHDAFEFGTTVIDN